MNEIYQDANQGEQFDFELTRELEQIQVLLNDAALKSQKWIAATNHSEVMSQLL